MVRASWRRFTGRRLWSDQHVGDLAQCAVVHQTAVIKHMVEAAEIITFVCDRLQVEPLLFRRQD